MNTGVDSRAWGVALTALALLLVLDISAIALKSRKTTAEPAIQDVFLKEKPQFTPDLGQLLTLVPPTDYVATTPESHGPQYRTADWLRAQGGMAWTLQVMQSDDEEVVKEYLAKRPDKELFAYFAQRNDGKTQYVVVFGNYVTRELAMGEAATKDFSLPQGLPGPAKLFDYVDKVPVLEPAIDAPPPARYGDVPELAPEPDLSMPEAAPEGVSATDGLSEQPTGKTDAFDPFAAPSP
ncbi:SPOR domain-containing protein [Fluviicoccus sp.]|uniref:SPOR domain-containing protein n=1 Tax=Fluviicoccus sp. TaxID=2003552 RepID=UPI00351E515D